MPVVLQRQPLTVADVDSPLEREADRIADRIIAMPMGTGEPQVQRMCPECDEELRRQPTGENEEGELQLKSEAGGPRTAGAEAAAAAVAHGGQPLSAAERAYFEPRFARDLSDVRVHDKPRAHLAAETINARAYTLGSHIAFAAGEYRPVTPTGRRLLAHEIAHVPQHGATEPSREIVRAPDDLGTIPAGELDVGGPLLEQARQRVPAFRPRTPRAPPLSTTWRTKVLLAMGERHPHRQAAAFQGLVSEALAAQAARYPHLSLSPVRRFVSEADAVHGEVLFDSSLPGAPGRVGIRGLTSTVPNPTGGTPKVFIRLGPASLSPEGPDFTRRALQHEHVHFVQNVRGLLTKRPDCKPRFRGSPLGGNPNRELIAVSRTFSRFFPAWANQPGATIGDVPHHVKEDLKLFQAYFRCADESLQSHSLAEIANAVRRESTKRRLLSALIEEVRNDDLPDVTRTLEDDGLRRLAIAIGAPIGPDPRLPQSERQRQPLIDPRRLGEEAGRRMRERLFELAP